MICILDVLIILLPDRASKVCSGFDLVKSCIMDESFLSSESTRIDDLRCPQIIMAKQAGGPKKPEAGGMDED